MELVHKEDDLELLEYMHITSIKEQDQKSLDAIGSALRCHQWCLNFSHKSDSRDSIVS